MAQQLGLFSSEDNKTVKGKKAKGYQMALFSADNMTGQGKRSNLAGEWRGRLELEKEDPRTEEQKDADRQAEAEALTIPMFAQPIEAAPEKTKLTVKGLGKGYTIEADIHTIFSFLKMYANDSARVYYRSREGWNSLTGTNAAHYAHILITSPRIVISGSNK